MMNDEEFKEQYPLEAKVYAQYKTSFRFGQDDYLKEMLIALRQEYKSKEESEKSITTLPDDVIQEYKETLESPTSLAALLTGFGYRGILKKKTAFYNTAISDKKVGTYEEILNLG